jgi:hypothetical protein
MTRLEILKALYEATAQKSKELMAIFKLNKKTDSSIIKKDVEALGKQLRKRLVKF